MRGRRGGVAVPPHRAKGYVAEIKRVLRKGGTDDKDRSDDLGSEQCVAQSASSRFWKAHVGIRMRSIFDK